MAGPAVTKGLRILHLSHDNKFVAAASRYFEEVSPGANRYIILAPSGEAKYSPLGEIQIAKTAGQAQQLVLDEAQHADALVVHFMYPAWAKIVPEIAKRISVVWSGFGGDYYGKAGNGDFGSLGPLTLAISGRQNADLTLPGKLHRWWGNRPNEGWLREAARACAFFSAPVPDDLGVFIDRFPGFAGKFAQLNYAHASVDVEGPLPDLGKNMLVGNSATPTNNHLETFERLAGTDLQGRKVIVPLSYGDAGEYREAVLAAGQRTFGSDFMPLLELLPPAEYNEVIADCEFVIMGHMRQQGLGNVITAIASGATVVLDTRNPVHTSLKNDGFIVRAVDEFEGTTLERLALDDNQRASNISTLDQVWGRERVLARVRGLIAAFEGPRG